MPVQPNYSIPGIPVVPVYLANLIHIMKEPPSVSAHITALPLGRNLASLLTSLTHENSYMAAPEVRLPKRSPDAFPNRSSRSNGPEVKLAKRLPRAVRNKSSTSSDNESAEQKRRFICDTCQDRFRYKHVLQNHTRTHTGEKPFKCEVRDCGRRFTRDHHLKTHMRLHTGEKPYSCKNCGKRFVQVANLRRHVRIHDIFVCKFESCDQRFSDASKLHTHLLLHMNSPVSQPPPPSPVSSPPLMASLPQVRSELRSPLPLPLLSPRQSPLLSPRQSPPSMVAPIFVSHCPCFQTKEQDEPEDLSLKSNNRGLRFK